MNKKNILKVFIPILVFLFLVVVGVNNAKLKEETMDLNSKKMEATVLSVDDNSITVLNENNSIYNIPIFGNNIKSGDNLIIEYTGLIDENKNIQSIKVVNYEEQDKKTDKSGIPTSWNDDGIFSDYYIMAYNKLKKLSLDEKIGQILLVRYPDGNISNILDKYKLGGFVFFAKDFKDKDKSQVENMISSAQKKSSIPLLTAVDEEGGSVVRVSSNPKLVSTQFKSSKELYKSGGFDAIKNDTIKKSKVLKDLGLNLNLAPVVDISTNATDYMYNRALGEDKDKTSTFAKTVIEASKNTGVSYTLKHFPGYGNNSDTHYSGATDERTYEDIMNNDILPFKTGINAGAEAVLVSHNTVTNIDKDNPASISPAIHNLLRTNLDFTGVIITDDIAMGAVSDIDNVTVKALLSGNDLIITTDYEKSFSDIKKAINDKSLDESILDQHVFKVLAWKYYKGMMIGK